MEPPSRFFMEVLSHFVDEIHAEKLREFCSKSVDGKSEYYRYCVRERRTAFEVLQDFQPTGKLLLPIEYLIQLSGR
jgi:sulfite reductase alpha subunit-like flavoprotein